MAAQSHQTWDDGSFAEAHVAHDDHAVSGRLPAAQVSFRFLEQPLSAREHGVGRDAGHLEQEWLQSDVRGPIRGEAHCIMGGKEGQLDSYCSFSFSFWTQTVKNSHFVCVFIMML